MGRFPFIVCSLSWLPRLTLPLAQFGEVTSVSLMFRTTIGRSTVIPQTQKAGRTLFETHPDHKVTHEYRALAEELEQRQVDGVI